MGTFPTKPFGERIISQVPADQAMADKSQSGEIPGALVDEHGRPVDGATPGMENGVPVDQIVRPDDSPASDKMKNAPMEASKANKSGGIQGLKNEVKVFIDPNTGQTTLIGDDEDLSLIHI